MISKEVKDSLITYAMVGAIAYLFTGIGEGKHERDVSNTKQDILLQSDGKLWNYVDEDLRWKNDFEIRHAEEQVKNAEKWADHYREILMNLQNKDQ
jgi:hypothetical protein|tara:strand:- start:378 stop:665 length:288 start_codon:yes stop_codon:yes gene_type:complete